MRLACAGIVLLLVSAPVAAAELFDGWGRSIDIPPRPPERIVALAPHLAEGVFALGFGAQVVATVAYADHPSGARAIPRVGDAFTLSFEALIAARPDWILVWGATLTPSRLRRLEALGAPVYVSEPRSLADIARELAVLTDVLGGGEQVVQDLRRRIDALSGNADAPTRQVLPLIASKPPLTLARDHFLTDVLAQCGAANPFATATGPVVELSRERLLAAQLDAVLNLSGGPLPSELLLAPGTVVVDIDPDLLVRPGPRVVEGAEALCAQLGAQLGTKRGAKLGTVLGTVLGAPLAPPP